jgi:hypothetical protein
LSVGVNGELLRGVIGGLRAGAGEGRVDAAVSGFMRAGNGNILFLFEKKGQSIPSARFI